MTKLLEIYPYSIDTSKRCIGIGTWHEYSFKILVTDELNMRNKNARLKVAMHVKIVDTSPEHYGDNITEKYSNCIRIEGYMEVPNVINADIIEWM